MWDSLGAYLRAVILNFWAWVAGISTILGTAALFVTGGVVLPLWVGLAAGFVCLNIAQFQAYHQLRRRPPPTTVGAVPIQVNADTVHMTVHVNQPPAPDQTPEA